MGWGVQGGSTPLQSGVTALLLAAEHGHMAIVEALVTAGADVNVQNKVCTSPHPALTSLIVSTVGAGCAATGRVTTTAAPGCH
jgi:ankyrin repeat protein